MLELTLALHTLYAIQSTNAFAATAPWLNNRLAWGKSRRCLAMNTALADAVGSWSSRHRQLMALPHAAWPQPLVRPRQYFAALQLQQTTAPSSPVAVPDSSTHSSPHALPKSQISSTAGAGGDGPARVVECLSGGVETLQPIAHIPFGPSALLFASAVYFEDTPASRTPPDSLAYTTQWADRVTTYK